MTPFPNVLRELRQISLHTATRITGLLNRSYKPAKQAHRCRLGLPHTLVQRLKHSNCTKQHAADIAIQKQALAIESFKFSLRARPVKLAASRPLRLWLVHSASACRPAKLLSSLANLKCQVLCQYWKIPAAGRPRSEAATEALKAANKPESTCYKQAEAADISPARIRPDKKSV